MWTRPMVTEMKTGWKLLVGCCKFMYILYFFAHKTTALACVADRSSELSCERKAFDRWVERWTRASRFKESLDFSFEGHNGIRGRDFYDCSLLQPRLIGNSGQYKNLGCSESFHPAFYRCNEIFKVDSYCTHAWEGRRLPKISTTKSYW